MTNSASRRRKKDVGCELRMEFAVEAHKVLGVSLEGSVV